LNLTKLKYRKLRHLVIRFSKNNSLKIFNI
jgi:hypothetical protein